MSSNLIKNQKCKLFVYWSRAGQLWPHFFGLRLAGLIRLGWLVGFVGNTCTYVWQGFCHYGPWWSPIRELVAAAIAYSDSHCAVLSHKNLNLLLSIYKKFSDVGIKHIRISVILYRYNNWWIQISKIYRFYSSSIKLN